MLKTKPNNRVRNNRTPAFYNFHDLLGDTCTRHRIVPPVVVSGRARMSRPFVVVQHDRLIYEFRTFREHRNTTDVKPNERRIVNIDVVAKIPSVRDENITVNVNGEKCQVATDLALRVHDVYTNIYYLPVNNYIACGRLLCFIRKCKSGIEDVKNRCCACRRRNYTYTCIRRVCMCVCRKKNK